MTVSEIISKEAIRHIARRDYVHKKWLERQTDYREIKERDCYGYKSAKVQNVEGIGKRSIKAR